ncbi:hypothetical protein [uncultured Mucilaginibacter sp.]|uniref:hypothetical protein n=1 Tax=uncultured Mucilaginibacter sp. TaxID=797541 RepID=UPI00261532E4|nr:hypothetical protein [uncultured Mucilaginibacter sp.]
MKKLLFNSNPFILLLAPVFLLWITALFHWTIHLQLPDMQTEVTGLFDRKTVFQVLCEVVKTQF